MYKTTIHILPLSIFFALLFVGCASSQEASRAMYDWGTSDPVEYDVVQAQNQSIEIPGQGTQETTSTSATSMTLEATGPFQFKITITDAEATGSPLSVDPIIGLESEVVIQPNGLLTSASGLTGNAYIDGMGGEEVFRESLQALFQIVPDETLAQGVEWTNEISMPIERMGLEMSREVSDTYSCTQLTTYEGTPAFEIESTSKISMSGSGNQGGQEMDLLIQGTMTGTTYIDAATGQLLSTEQSGKLSGIIDMAEASLPIVMDITTSVNVAK